jgi:hypothetical protein
VLLTPTERFAVTMVCLSTALWLVHCGAAVNSSPPDGCARCPDASPPTGDSAALPETPDGPRPIATSSSSRSTESPVAVAAGPANLRSLTDPDRLWVRDEWAGLGPSYDFMARLQRVGEQYDAECMLRVQPFSHEGTAIPDRVEAKRLSVAAQLVRTLVQALRGSILEPQAPGLIELSPIDDHAEADALLFPRKGGAPLWLHVGPSGSVSVDLDRHYRLKSGEAVNSAYRALLDALGVRTWVLRMNDTATRPGRSGASP